MRKIIHWEEWEDEIQDQLTIAQRYNSLAFQRFYDTKSAGSMLPAMPADFLAGHNGIGYFIEAKFSEVHESLRSCFSNSVQAHQLASARIWNRANFRYIFLFHSSKSGIVEAWPGLYCSDRRSMGKPLELKQRTVYEGAEQALKGEIGYG